MSFRLPMKKEEKCLAAMNWKTFDSYVHVTLLYYLHQYPAFFPFIFTTLSTVVTVIFVYILVP